LEELLLEDFELELFEELDSTELELLELLDLDELLFEELDLFELELELLLTLLFKISSTVPVQ